MEQPLPCMRALCRPVKGSGTLAEGVQELTPDVAEGFKYFAGYPTGPAFSGPGHRIGAAPVQASITQTLPAR